MFHAKSSIDASYQVSIHLAEGFQRRRLKCEKLPDDGCQVMAKAHISFGFDFSLCNFLRSGVLPLFTLVGSQDICILMD
jgi:hypothetical protein